MILIHKFYVKRILQVNKHKINFFVFSVRNGYSSVPIALTEGLDVRLNTAVKKIKYFDGGVEVTVDNLKTTNSPVVHKGKQNQNFNPI